jgi:Las1-like
MSLALIRFVNSLLDPLQKRDKSLPLGVLAASAGLPTVFVEVRHWGTHESNLPGNEVLRDMGIRALEWLWRNYWNKKEDSVDAIALWKSSPAETRPVIEAFAKNQEDSFERLVVELAGDNDFSTSRTVLDPLLLFLLEELSEFPEAFIDYIIQTCISIPTCEIPRFPI